MSRSGCAVMRIWIFEGSPEIPLASVSRRALRDGPSALSSRVVMGMGLETRTGSRVRVLGVRVQASISQPSENPHAHHGVSGSDGRFDHISTPF